MHLSEDLYRYVRRGHVSVEQLWQLAHRHLLEICPACRAEFAADQQVMRLDTASEATVLPPEVPLPPARPPAGTEEALPQDASHIGEVHLRPRSELLEGIRYLRDLTRRHLSHLLEHPPERWLEEIENARSRYRLRAFAERLVEESRRRVRADPDLAGRLAGLVPHVLHWVPGSGGERWAIELEVRATAWEANALRVKGDLRAADALFRTIQHDLVVRGAQVGEWVRGEVASLRASLRTEQRLPEAAHRDLDEARTSFQRLGDQESTARVLIQSGNLASVLGASLEALDFFARASTHLDDLEDVEDLRCCVVSGQVSALCHLGRYPEAQRVLARNRPLLKRRGDSYVQAIGRYHEGRIALGLGDLEAAARTMLDARELFLDMGRLYDGIVAALDLAQVYLEAGRLDELEELAAGLVPQFQVRGVARESLAALRLLAQAAAAREVSRELLGKLREGVQPGRAAGAPVTPSAGTAGPASRSPRRWPDPD